METGVTARLGQLRKLVHTQFISFVKRNRKEALVLPATYSLDCVSGTVLDAGDPQRTQSRGSKPSSLQ